MIPAAVDPGEVRVLHEPRVPADARRRERDTAEAGRDEGERPVVRLADLAARVAEVAREGGPGVGRRGLVAPDPAVGDDVRRRDGEVALAGGGEGREDDASGASDGAGAGAELRVVREARLDEVRDDEAVAAHGALGDEQRVGELERPATRELAEEIRVGVGRVVPGAGEGASVVLRPDGRVHHLLEDELERASEDPVLVSHLRDVAGEVRAGEAPERGRVVSAGLLAGGRADEHSDAVVAPRDRRQRDLGVEARPVVLVRRGDRHDRRLREEVVHEPGGVLRVRVVPPAGGVRAGIGQLPEVGRRKGRVVAVLPQHVEERARVVGGGAAQVPGDLRPGERVRLVAGSRHGLVQEPEPVVDGDVAHGLELPCVGARGIRGDAGEDPDRIDAGHRLAVRGDADLRLEGRVRDLVREREPGRKVVPVGRGGGEVVDPVALEVPLVEVRPVPAPGDRLERRRVTVVRGVRDRQIARDPRHRHDLEVLGGGG